MHHRNEDAEQTKHQKEKKCSLESSYPEAVLPLPFFPFHSMHLLFLESPANIYSSYIFLMAILTFDDFFCTPTPFLCSVRPEPAGIRVLKDEVLRGRTGDEK